ncbi:CatB-related O-acetyltransferase [Maritimibacter sp. UBA3975]|uniref:CatB-related O-acetyltransferase n=1 Tax=Maritimibacter sp. UBA3975 TaxID=1946833 RepID=UPI000C09F339|nr:CatB-related O-acetyltransferase [Maritimibacter sp. UBA3975]MAM60076.1 acetyltransferase [Maritimibacter sp.]|tara:strand:+ start:1276 stop:1941 length:666 start_codon:yes stop_codon:yes gene_type:complete
MAVPFLDANARHPITLPDGSTYENTVWLKSVIDHPNIEVGDYSYYNDFEPVTDYAARIAPYLHPGAPERLVIGKFCQFANGTRFITSSADHPKRWFTSFPFAVFDHSLMDLFAEEFAKGGDTVIGNDVWIGDSARIMPGVTLGDGVIVGSGAVVTRDVPSWSIVAGNQGRVIRRRFPDAVCDRLDRLAWWDRDPDDIRTLVPVLASADVGALDDCLRSRGL